MKIFSESNFCMEQSDSCMGRSDFEYGEMTFGEGEMTGGEMTGYLSEYFADNKLAFEANKPLILPMLFLLH